MDIMFLLKGFVIGVAASIPLGPIGVLCIQRTLSKNFKAGYLSGLGAASADTIFAIVAMFFLSLVTAFIEGHIVTLTIIGGAVIMFIGFSIFAKKIKPITLRRNRAVDRNYFKDYISVFLLTLTNPAFIFVFFGLFTSFGISYSSLTLPNSILTIIGVLFGASSWWFMLTFGVHLLRGRFKPRHLVVINRVAGILIFLLGLAAIISAIFDSSLIKKLV